jgi:hypothetical protein
MKFNLKSLIILFCILYGVLLVIYVKSEKKYASKGRLYNVYDITGKEIKIACVKLNDEVDYQDFEGHYTGFYYEVTKEECE